MQMSHLCFKKKHFMDLSWTILTIHCSTDPHFFYLLWYSVVQRFVEFFLLYRWVPISMKVVLPFSIMYTKTTQFNNIFWFQIQTYHEVHYRFQGIALTVVFRNCSTYQDSWHILNYCSLTCNQVNIFITMHT